MTDLSRVPSAATAPERRVRARRPVRLPLLAAAVALVLLTAVLILWGFGRASDRTEVLTLDAPVEAGTPIPPDALSTTLVGVDSGVGGFVPPGTDLSGVVAAADLAPGDVLSRSMLRTAPAVPEGWREVGALVRLGRYPTLSVGDEVIAVPVDATPGVDAGEVSVVVVATNTSDDRSLSVVLSAPPESAAEVAQWAATDRLALVRVP